MESDSILNRTLVIAGMVMMTNSTWAQHLNTDFKDDFRKKNNNESELQLNEDAIKLIKFDFMPEMSDEINKPMEAPLEKSWMKFKSDLTVPKSLTDTTKVRKPEGYIRMLPYSIWTKFGEDPVYDVMVFGKKKEYNISWTINPFGNSSDNYGKSISPSAGVISDGMRIRGAGIAIGGLDIMGFFYYNLTPRGRMLQHNMKHANAWKIYDKYQPTLADSLKFPTFYNGLTALVFDYENTGSGVAVTGNITEMTDSMKAEISRIISEKEDSLRTIYLENANEKADKERNPDRVKRNFRWDVRKARQAKKEKDKEDELKAKEEKMIEELPGSMDSIYIYMREKEKREAAKRAEEEKIRKMRFGIE